MSREYIGPCKLTYRKQVVVHGTVEEDENFFYITTDRGESRISKQSVESIELVEYYEQKERKGKKYEQNNSRGH